VNQNMMSNKQYCRPIPHITDRQSNKGGHISMSIMQEGDPNQASLLDNLSRQVWKIFQN
jgi:hypothetical protein